MADFGDAELRVRPVADPKASQRAGEQAADGVEKGFDGERRGRRGGGSFATGMVAGVAGGLASQLPALIGGFAGDLFGLAGAMEEIDRRAGVVFGDNLPRATAAIDNMNEKLGLSQSQALGAAAGIQDILVPLGFARDEATGMTLDLLELGGALAGNTGGTRTAEEAHQALTAALTGEREQLKAYGVVLNEEMVKQRVAEMATRGLTFATEGQAKAAATLELATEASSDAITLWNNRAGTQAEATAAAKARMQEAKEELAQGLAPAMLAGTELAAGFADGLASATGFLMEHKDVVLIAAGAYAAYQGAVGLQGVISKLNAAKAAHGSFTQAMRAGITKAFNPTALAVAAVAVGIGVMVKRWQDAKAARAEFNRDAAATAKALTDENGIVMDLSGSWGALGEGQRTAADALAQYLETDSRFKDKNQLDDLNRLGLSFDDLGEAIHGTEDDFRAFVQRAVDAGEVTLTSAESMDRLLEAYRAGPDALKDLLELEPQFGAVVQGNTQLLRSFAHEQDVTIEGLRDLALGAVTAAQANGAYGSSAADAMRETIRSSESIAELTGIQNTATAAGAGAGKEAERLAARYGTLTGEVDGTTDALDADNDALAEAEDQAEDTRTELEKLTDQYGHLTDLVDEARQAIDRMNGGQVSLDDATLGLQESTDKLTESIDENGATFDVSTAAGRKNMEQARDTAQSIRDLELAMIENGSSAEEAAAAGDFLRESLRRQLEQAGMTAAEVDALIDTYGEVPDEVRTAMAADTGLASFAVATYTGLIRNIPTHVNTLLTVQQHYQAPTGQPVSAFTGRADGGRIGAGRDVLVGERGPEVIRLDGAAGANVIPNHQLGQAGAGIVVQELQVNVSGTMDLDNPDSARRLAVRVQEALVHLEAENR